MSELWAKNNNVFDENADYAMVLFICKGEKPSAYTYMKAGLVGGTYVLSYNGEKFNISENNVVTKKINKEGAIKVLQEYDWTGNIRELRNVIERLIILGGKEVSADDVMKFASK